MLTEKTYVLCILAILIKYSDPDHILSVKDIQEKLRTIYDINADRRTIYRNVDALIEFGYDVSKFNDNKEGYFLRERDFEPSELHMLCDAVLTADCIPEKQGKALIKKLQSLGSVYQTKCINRLALMKTDKKSLNPQIFYNIDLLDEAITQKRQIEFDYYTYDLDLQLKPRRNKKYIANPYALYWSNGNYYLLSNMDSHEGVTHFRLDRMRNLIVTGNPSKPAPKDFNEYEYASRALFMFGGEAQTFTIKCDRKILNDVIDRFGEKIMITESDENSFTAIVNATSGGMRIWSIHYIETCQVLSPEWLVSEVADAIEKGMRNYAIPDYVVSLLYQVRELQREAKLAFGEDKFISGYALAHTSIKKFIGRPYSANYYSDRFLQVLKENGMAQMRLHDLRHSFGSNLLYQGIPIPTVSKMMGHSSVAITMKTYAHEIEELTAQNEETINLLIEETVSSVRHRLAEGK